MSLSGETKFFIGIVVATVIILIGAVFFFSQPTKPVDSALLIPKEAWATGSAQPKSTLVEFSDFECPACIQAQPFVKQVLDKYQDRLQLVYRHYPLPQHSLAPKAAEAAEAAGTQGKFWAMHDGLFKLNGDLTIEKMSSLAAELKLDMDKFDKDLKEDSYKDKIQKDIDDGNKIGFNSTPTFFLNGLKLNLLNFSDLVSEVAKVVGK